MSASEWILHPSFKNGRARLCFNIYIYIYISAWSEMLSSWLAFLEQFEVTVTQNVDILQHSSPRGRQDNFWRDQANGLLLDTFMMTQMRRKVMHQRPLYLQILALCIHLSGLFPFVVVLMAFLSHLPDNTQNLCEHSYCSRICRRPGFPGSSPGFPLGA